MALTLDSMELHASKILYTAEILLLQTKEAMERATTAMREARDAGDSANVGRWVAEAERLHDRLELLLDATEAAQQHIVRIRDARYDVPKS
jgi:hypothetical protein